MKLTPREELAALEGWASNGAVPLDERLQAAQQVIRELRKIITVLESSHCPCDRLGCTAL